MALLTNEGVPTYLRKPRGRDIYAACGQLKRTVEGEGMRYRIEIWRARLVLSSEPLFNGGFLGAPRRSRKTHVASRALYFA
jgi:hypothetical protein